MSIREYIKKEVEQMRSDCQKYQITPEEWISRYATQFYKLHFEEIKEALDEDRPEL